ncbi:MAG: hypothetical protein WKH64_03925 [Chloroflexia bacterium]
MSARGAAGAGVVGAVAYAVEMELDQRILDYPFDDLAAARAARCESARLVRPLGLAIHLANGALAGVVYARVCRLLPGPGWLRGLLFGQIENAMLWPLMLAVDRYHPARKDGSLPPAWSRRNFVAAVARHAAFGLTLGLIYRPQRRRGRRRSRTSFTSPSRARPPLTVSALSTGVVVPSSSGRRIVYVWYRRL